MPSISRRKVLSLGVMASTGSLLPCQLAEALLPRGLPQNILACSVAQGATLSAPDLLAVIPVSDPSSEVVVNRLFPGLLSDSGFLQLRPVSFLVSNISKVNIRAFSTCWTMTTLSGKSEMTVKHYFHPRLGSEGLRWEEKMGNKAFFTGKVPVIKAGATRLVTPFFGWSPGFYKENNKPDWTKLVLRRREVTLSELASEDTGVAMRISAAITNDYASVGPDDEYLARVFCITRNAEHDESVSMRRIIATGASPDQVKDQLRRDGAGLDFHIRPNSALYYRVRQRQARVLLRRLKRANWEQFLETLVHLRNQPKTRRRPLQSAP